ncbi:MAG: hypothetical protein LUC26_01435 [Prevotella sp.]|nr:hypothetical protein [Prevotella sp.]
MAKTVKWARKNLDDAIIPNSPPNAKPQKRTIVDTSDGHAIGVGIKFFTEMAHKNKNNPQLPEIIEASTHFKEWIPLAKITGTEKGNHHSFNFSAYKANWNGYNILFKCKMTDGELLYNMTFQ